MKKLQSFLAVAALMLGSLTASAYTTSDLTSAGWSLVTGDLADVSNYYYLFVDGTNTNLAIAHSGGLTSSRPVYQLLQEPTVSTCQVWMLEADADKFIMQSYADNYYYTNGSAGWNNSMIATADGNSKMTFTMQDGKYHISTSAGYLGGWDTYDLSGSGAGYASVAGNNGGSGTLDHGYYVYQIARASFTPATKASTNYVNAGWHRRHHRHRLPAS